MHSCGEGTGGYLHKVGEGSLDRSLAEERGPGQSLALGEVGASGHSETHWVRGFLILASGGHGKRKVFEGVEKALGRPGGDELLRERNKAHPSMHLPFLYYKTKAFSYLERKGSVQGTGEA